MIWVICAVLASYIMFRLWMNHNLLLPRFVEWKNGITARKIIDDEKSVFSAYPNYEIKDQLMRKAKRTSFFLPFDFIIIATIPIWVLPELLNISQKSNILDSIFDSSSMSVSMLSLIVATLVIVSIIFLPCTFWIFIEYLETQEIKKDPKFAEHFQIGKMIKFEEQEYKVIGVQQDISETNKFLITVI